MLSIKCLFHSIWILYLLITSSFGYHNGRLHKVETKIQLNAEAPSVWTVFGDIATKTGAYNLGQGFPDWQPPNFVLDSLMKTISTGNHQYTRPAGHPPLARVLASSYSQHLNRIVDPMNEITITVGASQALYLTLMTLLKPGDEVVMFEPYFDLYLKQIKLVPNVTPKFVSLGGDSATLEDPWALDINALKSAITEKTKILILNSPHNPTGKIFTLQEMNMIADIVREHPNLIVISDEVYKYSIYDPLEPGDSYAKGHYHFARLPDMWDRTVTLSSCGKTFSITGWQVGWMVGPSKYMLPIQEMIPCVQFCASTPIQAALTLALPQAYQPYEGYETYYEWLRSQFHSKRKILENGLSAMGIHSLPSNGGFFLLAKLPEDSKCSLEYSKNNPNFDHEPYDWRYCRMLAEDYGVVGIPAGPFFATNSAYASQLGPMARFAICKKDETIYGAANQLISMSQKRALETSYMKTIDSIIVK